MFILRRFVDVGTSIGLTKFRLNIFLLAMDSERVAISPALRSSPVCILGQTLGPLLANKWYWRNDNTTWPAGTVSETLDGVERRVPVSDWQ